MKTVEERLDALEATLKLLLKSKEIKRPKNDKFVFINNNTKFTDFSRRYIENYYQCNTNADSKYYGVNRKTIYNWRKRIEENL